MAQALQAIILMMEKMPPKKDDGIKVKKLKRKPKETVAAGKEKHGDDSHGE